MKKEKRFGKKLLTALCAFSFLGTAVLASCSDEGDDSDTVDENKEQQKINENEDEKYDDSALSECTLWVVGDSTVSSFNDTTYFYPRYGYGTQLGNFLSSKVTVQNLALSGRSSKSFLSEDNYATLKSGMKNGDFLLIGFGHNDEKSDDEERFTDASKDTTDSTSFKYSLYENYVKIAENAGTTPILCSPIVRWNKSNDYSGSSAHITSNGDYGKAVVELGTEKSVQVVDLTSLTKSLYTELGADEARYFHAVAAGSSDTEPNFDTIDGTHINIYGANMVDYLIAKTIKDSDCALKPYIKSTAKPEKASTLVKNPDYKYVAYTTVDWSAYSPADNLKTISEGWYGTGFGDCGGDPSVSSNGYYATETSSGTFKVGQTETSSPKGKITSTADGIAFCFRQVPVSDNFKLTAKAKILTVAAAKNQAGFGLMLRDDCYTPNKVAVSTNYVAAGLYASGTAETTVNFSRESTALKLTENKISALYKADETAEFTIERTGQVVKVTTVYGEKTYETTYTDFDFVAQDNAYMYVGMFGTRGTTAEFTEVTYEKTGTSQGA